jgi:hypothetical protein
MRRKGIGLAPLVVCGLLIGTTGEVRSVEYYGGIYRFETGELHTFTDWHPVGMLQVWDEWALHHFDEAANNGGFLLAAATWARVGAQGIGSKSSGGSGGKQGCHGTHDRPGRSRNRRRFH